LFNSSDQPFLQTLTNLINNFEAYMLINKTTSSLNNGFYDTNYDEEKKRIIVKSKLCKIVDEEEIQFKIIINKEIKDLGVEWLILGNPFTIAKGITKNSTISSNFNSKLMKFISSLRIKDISFVNLFIEECSHLLKENIKDSVLFGSDRNKSLYRLNEIVQPLLIKFEIIIV
jgi:hypothetical protein